MSPRREEVALSSNPVGVWRAISDCASRTWDPDLTTRVAAILRSLGNDPLHRVLDLGAGFGNPSLGLGRMGHSITAVEADPAMTEVFRAASVPQNVQLISAEWQALLPTLAADSQDCALLLGNALAYQESWPAKPLSGHDLTSAVGNTLTQLSRIVRLDGLLICEMAFETPNTGVELFTRRYEHEEGAWSLWLVKCDHDLRVRAIDTLLYSSLGATAASGYARYEGFLLYGHEFATLARCCGWEVCLAPTTLRPPFSTIVARNTRATMDPE